MGCFRFKQSDPEHLRDEVTDRLEQAEASVRATIVAIARELPDLAEQARSDLPDWVSKLLTQEATDPRQASQREAADQPA